mmetsp:Transcript_18861/g.47973  ORF Transcript_18861/g.47973 Transcript_18861/m.47973 type:complete len:383 (+) Transcript_18861:445-1593(+)
MAITELIKKYQFPITLTAAVIKILLLAAIIVMMSLILDRNLQKESDVQKLQDTKDILEGVVPLHTALEKEDRYSVILRSETPDNSDAEKKLRKTLEEARSTTDKYLEVHKTVVSNLGLKDGDYAKKVKNLRDAIDSQKISVDDVVVGFNNLKADLIEFLATTRESPSANAERLIGTLVVGLHVLDAMSEQTEAFALSVILDEFDASEILLSRGTELASLDTMKDVADDNARKDIDRILQGGHYRSLEDIRAGTFEALKGEGGKDKKQRRRYTEMRPRREESEATPSSLGLTLDDLLVAFENFITEFEGYLENSLLHDVDSELDNSIADLELDQTLIIIAICLTGVAFIYVLVDAIVSIVIFWKQRSQLDDFESRTVKKAAWV